jgi:primosomal protein N'
MKLTMNIHSGEKCEDCLLLFYDEDNDIYSCHYFGSVINDNLKCKECLSRKENS